MHPCLHEPPEGPRSSVRRIPWKQSPIALDIYKTKSINEGICRSLLGSATLTDVDLQNISSVNTVYLDSLSHGMSISVTYVPYANEERNRFWSSISQGFR